MAAAPLNGRGRLALSPDAVVSADIADLLSALSADANGLSSHDAVLRLREHGPNDLPTEPAPGPVALLVAQVVHTLALLLWAAAAVAFLAGIPEIGWAIIAIVGVNAAFSFWQEYRASRLGQALRRRIPAGARVLRDGAEHRLPARDVVPGDILLVRAGDRVPADARLLAATSLALDYSVLTGESEPVERGPGTACAARLEEAANCIVAGSTVVRGSGRALVVATGPSTVYGGIVRLTGGTRAEPSPLQRELTVTSHAIAAVALVVGAVFFVLGALVGGISVHDSFVFALGILVAIIPEGLLPTVSLALALSVQRMSHRQALVKRLSSVEALGSTDVICTDKTGTITINEMTVRELLVADAHYHVTGRGFSLRGSLHNDSGDDRVSADAQALLCCAVLCNHGIPAQPHRRRTDVGDPLDESLLVLAAKAELDVDAVRAGAPTVAEFPFEAARRSMATVHRVAPGRFIVYVKGGPLEILDRCTGELRNGLTVSLTDERRADLRRAADGLTERGLRALAFAQRSAERPPASAAEAERDLVFLGMAGIDNPLRSEVPAAVELCSRAGITVVMLTGDHAHTAAAVAAEAGIAPRHAYVVTGADVDQLADDGLDDLLRDRDPRVFARVAPEQKLRLVQAYRRIGRIVAVTGDGVNDAPALRSADVGVAMGRRGTDVAREAADMILLDDNFATIVSAVEEGRAVYANIRKFLTYFLTSNVAEAMPFVVFVLFGVPLPLTVLQVLLVDLGTDLLPGLALGAEPPGPGTMDPRPNSQREHIVTPRLLVRALGFLGLTAAGLSLAGYFAFQWDVTGSVGSYASEGSIYRQATTMTLAGIVACQVANVFACRSETQSLLRLGLMTNRPLLFAVAAEIALLASFIGVPFLRGIFDLEPIEPRYWPVLISFPFIFLGLEEVRKLLRRAFAANPRAAA